MRLFSDLITLRPPRFLLALIVTLGLAACGGDSSEALLDQAKASLASGDLNSALIQLKGAIQKDQGNAEARFQLGSLYLEGGQYESAEKEFRRALEAGLAAERITPQLARALNGQGEFKRTLDEIPQPAAASPGEVDLLVARAIAHLGLGQKEAAQRSLEHALAIAPKHADAHLALARLALAERDLDAAFRAIDAALSHDPNHRDSWMLKGDLLRSTGQNKAAAAAYQSALKGDPHRVDARLALAHIAIAENRLADARKEVEVVLKASPKNLQGRYTQALIDFREKKIEAARDHLADVLKRAPDHLPSILLGGAIEYALGNMQTAESHLQKAVRAVPHNLYALRLLAATQLRLGRPDDAAKTLAPIDLEKVKDPGILAVAAEIALAKQDLPRATSLFEKAAALRPGNAAIRTELGIARLAQGDDRAMADLQAAAGMSSTGYRVDTLLILNQLKQTQFDAALNSIAALEKKQPKSPLPWNYRSAAYLGKGDLKKARDSLNQALRLDPTFFPAAANLAQLDLKAGQPAQARKRFEDVLSADPKHLQAMLALADLSLQNGDEKGYMAWLDKAAQAHPQALPPRKAMTRHLLARGEKNKALAIARAALDANPDHPAALDLLGSTQLASGDTVNAITTFTTLTKKVPQSADAHLRLAMAQFANQQRTDTRASLKRALQLQPDHLQSQDALIRLELAEQKTAAALQIARQIQTQHPKSPLGFEREADILLGQKRLPQAIQAYEQALARGAGSALLIKLHRAYLQVGNAQAADQRLTAWLKQHPDHHAVRAYAANHYTASGRYKDAIAQYQEIQRQAPANVVVLNNLASLYQREGDSRALATAEQALKLAPDNPSVQDTLGWILVEQGQVKRGQEWLRKALMAAPRHATIRYHHAVALARSGNRTQARAELEKLLADSPQFPDAAHARVLLQGL